jgi:solute carrier family 25 phosphate transporter 23/24/25/41
LEHTVRELDAIDNELLASNEIASELQRSALQLERKRILESKIPALRTALLEHQSVFQNTNDLSKLFCSELVAAVYQSVGWLPASPTPSNYTPKSFSTDSLPFLGHISLGPTLPLYLHSSSKHSEPASIVSAERRSIPSWLDRNIKTNLISHLTLRTAPLSALDRAQLLCKFVPVEFHSGDVIVPAGSTDEYLYVIERGECDVIAADPSSRSVSLGVLGPGNTFNTSSMAFGHSSPVTIRASRPHHTKSSADQYVVAWRLKRSDLIDALSASSGNSQRDKLQLKISSDSSLDRTSTNLISRTLNSHPHFKRFRLKAANGDKAFTDQAISSFYQIQFTAGETMISQGDRGELFYIVKDGECLVESVSSGAPVTVSTYRAGQTFGEASLLYNSTRGATVRALTDTTVLVIDRPTFQRLSGAGSKFLQRIFAAHASVQKDGQSFMSKQDFLTAARALILEPNSARSDQSSTEQLMLQLVKRGTGEDLISFSEFVHFDLLLSSPHCEYVVLFHLLDRRKTGMVGLQDMLHLLGAPSTDIIGTSTSTRSHQTFLIDLFGRDGLKQLNEAEFVSMFSDDLSHSLSRRQQLSDLFPDLFVHLHHMRKPRSISFLEDTALIQSVSSAPTTASSLHSAPLYMLSSGLAGAAARTLVAPIERLRLLMQSQLLLKPHDSPIRSLWTGLASVYRSDGVRGLFRGNALNVARVLPCLAIEFSIFEYLKHQWTSTASFTRSHSSAHIVGRGSSHDRLNLFELTMLGGAAGLFANVVLYPLDVLRSIVTVHRGTQTPPLSELIQSISRQGRRAMFRGLGTTALYITPYAGFSLAASESLRPLLPQADDSKTAPIWLVAGLAAGSALGQALVYPLDTIRRLQHVTASAPLCDQWGFRSIGQHIYRQHGLRGFYAGFSATLLKAVPSATASVFVFDQLSRAIAQLEN